MNTRHIIEREILFRFVLAPSQHLQQALAAGLTADDFQDTRFKAIFNGIAVMWARHTASFAPLPGKTRALVTEYNITELEKILKETDQFLAAGGRATLFSIPTANLTPVGTAALIEQVKGGVAA